MAEVLDSLGVIVELADCGHDLAQDLSGLRDDVRSASDEAERFAASAQSLSSVVAMAGSSLYRHCCQHADSKLMAYIADNNVLDSLSDESWVGVRRMRDASRKVVAMRSRFRLVAVARWIAGRRAILGLYPWMDSVKSSVYIVLCCVQLEMMHLSMQQNPPGSAEEAAKLKTVISNLEDAIKSHLETIEMLQARLERLKLTEPSSSFGCYSRQTAVSALGRSSLGTVTVPELRQRPADRPTPNPPPSPPLGQVVAAPRAVAGPHPRANVAVEQARAVPRAGVVPNARADVEPRAGVVPHARAQVVPRVETVPYSVLPPASPELSDADGLSEHSREFDDMDKELAVHEFSPPSPSTDSSVSSFTYKHRPASMLAREEVATNPTEDDELPIISVSNDGTVYLNQTELDKVIGYCDPLSGSLKCTTAHISTTSEFSLVSIHTARYLDLPINHIRRGNQRISVVIVDIEDGTETEYESLYQADVKWVPAGKRYVDGGGDGGAPVVVTCDVLDYVGHLLVFSKNAIEGGRHM